LNILFIGDIVGNPGREAVKGLLGGIVREKKVDFVIANGENSAGGLGITEKTKRALISYGVNVLTSGNHIWKRKEVFDIIEDEDLLRPANYPPLAPGRGYGIYSVGNIKVGVINIQGRVFMEAIDCPFAAADEVLEKMKNVRIIIVDMHAEATSEKLALGWYLDGKVSAVIGTHTHVQTADAAILSEGTAYVSDAGMTGSQAGIIGVEKEEIIRKFVTGLPFRFKVAKGREVLQGALLDINEKNGKVRSIRMLSRELETVKRG